jgi:uncharacterized coiled-coil protein SlyX
MQSITQLEEKFSNYEDTIKELFGKIQGKEIPSEIGFKNINQMLIEVKTIIGTQKVTLGQTELEGNKQAFPKEAITALKRRLASLRKESLDKIDKMTMNEVLGGPVDVLDLLRRRPTTQ